MGLLPKPIKKIVEQKALNSKTPPAKAKKKTQDSNQVKPTQSKRRKHLEKKKIWKIENTWSSTFAKATENANTKLRQWQQCKKSKCIEDLLDMNNANKDDVENLTCYSKFDLCPQKKP